MGLYPAFRAGIFRFWPSTHIQKLMRLESETNLITPPAIESGEFVPLDAGADFQQILASGIAAAQSGDRVSARRLLFQASGIDPRCEDIWMWLASISEYPEELLIFLGNALEINPENQRATEWRAATRSLLAKTFVQRAVAAHEEGVWAQAEQCIAQALTYNSECELAWLWKASFANDEEHKVEYLQKVLEINPDNADVQAALDAILTERSLAAFNEVKSAAVAGRRKKALDLVNEFLRVEPNIADAWILRSHLSLGMDEKIESLQRALEIDPENQTARSAYDFLSATVESTQEQTPEANFHAANAFDDPAEEVMRLSDDHPGESMVGGFEEEPAFEHSELVEQPLREAFESVASAADDAPDFTAQPSEDTFEFADLPVDVASDSFESTFLETFDVDSSPAEQEPDADPQIHDQAGFAEETANSEAIVLEEVQPLELREQHDIVPTSEDLCQLDSDEGVPQLAGSEISQEGLPEFTDRPIYEKAAEFRPEPGAAPTEYPAEKNRSACPFCEMPHVPQAFICDTCNAVMSLSDIEGLLNNPRADRETIQQAVTQMEAEWNLRDFSETELTQLGIGYFNLGDYEAGVKYLHEAARLDPNNVILSGQLNTIAIRLVEMRQQDEIHNAMPKGKTILVVDDSATVRKLISSKLEKSGHTVVCAEDGVEALERLGDGLPDLVLLDISMPRMDGYEVCKQIRNIPAARDLPVIMISGKDGFFDKVRGRMAGSTGYVTKPFGPETLMKALETYLVPEHQAAD
jgi:twitching motility two-component system response regulator PilG